MSDMYTDFSGGKGKSKKVQKDEAAAAYAQRQKELEAKANQVSGGTPTVGSPVAGTPAAGVPTASLLSGTEAEKQGQIAGMNVAALGYGQGLQTTGQDIQRVKELQRQRTAQSGGDPVSAAIMGQKAGQVANAQRNLAASGVKGATAAGAISNIERAANADIAASLYGQQQQSIADERSLASNTLAGTTGLMYGEKAANTRAPAAPSQSSSSFICTKLRSKGLMTGKETLIMTQFMLKSLITRSDFLVWYFRYGKAAVERAETQGFDWASIKTKFVDDIIDLIKQDKFEEAQNLYIHRTGMFCVSFGAKCFQKKLATRRFVAMFNFPRLLVNGTCIAWLKANFKNIPKILKADLV